MDDKTVKTECPRCKTVLNVPLEYADKKAKCPNCKGLFTPTLANKLKRKNTKSRSSQGKDSEESNWTLVKDFFMFRKFILPWLVIIFFILAVIVAGFSLISEFIPQPEPEIPEDIFQLPSEPASRFPSLPSWFWRISSVIFVLLWIRAICEVAIIIFQIYTKLGDIDGKLCKIEDGSKPR